MNKIDVVSKVKGSRLVGNKKAVSAALSAFEGKEVVLTIERKRNRRTNPQNRWYWGVAVELVRNQLKECGYQVSKEETHELIKIQMTKRDPETMLKEFVIESTGAVIKSMRSSADLTTTEFMAFKESIQQWAIEVLDLYIPDPNEQLTIA